MATTGSIQGRAREGGTWSPCNTVNRPPEALLLPVRACSRTCFPVSFLRRRPSSLSSLTVFYCVVVLAKGLWTPAVPTEQPSASHAQLSASSGMRSGGPSADRLATGTAHCRWESPRLPFSGSGFLGSGGRWVEVPSPRRLGRPPKGEGRFRVAGPEGLPRQVARGGRVRERRPRPRGKGGRAGPRG